MRSPAFQFYVRDWLTDTELSACPPLVRGVWIDLLANMWVAPKRGLLAGTVEQLSRMCRCTASEMNETVNTIKTSKVARVTFCNGKVTIVNRRMRREEIARKSNADRQKRHRAKHRKKGNAKSNAKVTSYSASASAFALKTDLADEKKSAGEKKTRKRNPLWDAICETFGLNPVTKSEKSRIGKIVRDLKLKDATPEEIPKRLENYRKRWPDITETPEALVKHWDTLRLSPAMAKHAATVKRREAALDKQQAKMDAEQQELEQKRKRYEDLKSQFNAMSPDEQGELRKQVMSQRAPPGGWKPKSVMLAVLALLREQR